MDTRRDRLAENKQRYLRGKELDDSIFGDSLTVKDEKGEQ
jgi:hypothetical protein